MLYEVITSPAQLFELSDKPNQITLEHIDMIRLFGLRKELTFSRQMFNMTVLGEQCFYMLTNYEFVKNNTDSKFCIRYDADNLDEIYVFDIDVITSYSIHYTKLYEWCSGDRGTARPRSSQVRVRRSRRPCRTSRGRREHPTPVASRGIA